MQLPDFSQIAIHNSYALGLKNGNDNGTFSSINLSPPIGGN